MKALSPITHDFFSANGIASSKTEFYINMLHSRNIFSRARLSLWDSTEIELPVATATEETYVSSAFPPPSTPLIPVAHNNILLKILLYCRGGGGGATQI